MLDLYGTLITSLQFVPTKDVGNQFLLRSKKRASRYSLEISQRYSVSETIRIFVESVFNLHPTAKGA